MCVRRQVAVGRLVRAASGPVVLTWSPAAVAVTFTVMVHAAPSASVPPVSPIVPLPATAVSVPLQPLDAPLGVATTRPAGSVSSNASPVSGPVAGAGW